MNILATVLLSICLLLLSLPVFAGPPAKAGVTRTQIEGEDDWSINNPISPGTITCPGGELMIDSITLMPYCADSKTGRLHWRDAVIWSCMTSYLDEDHLQVEERLTGIGLFTVNANFDASYSGPVWGKWKIVPIDCEKDDPYPAQEVEQADRFWHGTWNGKRMFYIWNGVGVWIGDLKIVGKGSGGNIDGLHFKGTELIETFSPLPAPYEALPGFFDPTKPEGIFTGTIKE